METDVGSVKESQSDKKASTIEEIPFITKRDKDETGELKLPEVQAKISEASEKLLSDKGIDTVPYLYNTPNYKIDFHIMHVVAFIFYHAGIFFAILGSAAKP